MRSLYDEVLAALKANTFTIPGVTVREPYDESPKEYPLIVLHEIVNIPKNHATVSGEDRTNLSYQIDIQTQSVKDVDGNLLGRYTAGRRLVEEVTELLDEEFKITRRTIRHEAIAPDVLQHVWRGDCTLDSYGYAYRI